MGTKNKHEECKDGRSTSSAEITSGVSLVRKTTIVSGMTLISRILGLLRDIVFARYFGANLVMDAFLVANRIPNMLRRFFAEGAFSQAFVPILSEYKSTREPEELKTLVDHTAGTLGTILLLVTVVGVAASPLLIKERDVEQFFIKNLVKTRSYTNQYDA